MRILVACEESQAVTKELRKLGHKAYSCDLLPCSGGHPEWHLQQDVREVLRQSWDMIIAHPPCTYLANSGVCWLVGNRAKPGRWDQLRAGAEFFRLFLDHPCPRIAIENPIMHKYAKELVGRAQDQVVQPYHFGHPERKATCFWLKGLPPLRKTDDVEEEMKKLPPNIAQRLHYLPPSPDRAILRSKTFPGIAKAIAEQWAGPAIGEGEL